MSEEGTDESVSPDGSRPAPQQRVSKSVSFHEDGGSGADDGASFFGSGGTPPGDGYDYQESPGGMQPSPYGEAPFSPPPPAGSFDGFPGQSAHKAPTRVPPEFEDWTGLGDRYELSKIVGSGSYGKVAEAFDRGKRGAVGASAVAEARKIGAVNGGRGTRVAIKQCQNVFGVLKEAKQMYRELHILRKLNGCSQIITLLNVMGPKQAAGQAFKDLYLVFEWADMDVHKLIHSPQFLSIRHVQSFAYQLLKGVKYMQSANVIHR